MLKSGSCGFGSGRVVDEKTIINTPDSIRTAVVITIVVIMIRFLNFLNILFTR